MLAPDIRDQVVAPELAGLGIDVSDYKLLVNPTGRFVVGGPMGDAGLTGRKIIVDTYGGFARHGGGAFSGKDPSKVDRSAAYAMRWVAKNAVAAGLAERLEVQVAYAIGKAAPVGLFVETFGTENVDPARISAAITEVFDLRPAAIIRDLDLLRPIYAPDRGVRALRPHRHRAAVGVDRPRRRAEVPGRRLTPPPTGESRVSPTASLAFPRRRVRASGTAGRRSGTVSRTAWARHSESACRPVARSARARPRAARGRECRWARAECGHVVAARRRRARGGRAVW